MALVGEILGPDERKSFLSQEEMRVYMGWFERDIQEHLEELGDLKYGQNPALSVYERTEEIGIQMAAIVDLHRCIRALEDGLTDPLLALTNDDLGVKVEPVNCGPAGWEKPDAMILEHKPRRDWRDIFKWK